MWARLLEVIVGIIVLVLAVYVLFNLNVAADILRWILGIGLIILGLMLLYAELLQRSSRQLAEYLTSYWGLFFWRWERQL